MQKNHALSRFGKSFATGLGLFYSLIFIIGTAYAFTTWNSGQAPQASPANGNVELSSGYVKGGLYGYRVTYERSLTGASGCNAATAPATCSGCPAGFTLVELGASSVAGDSYLGPNSDVTTSTYFACIKN